MPKHFTAATTLPFVRSAGGPTAEHLIATFPKLHPGPVAPKSQLFLDLGVIDAHRLLIGGDEHTFVGPNREIRGTTTGAKLIAREARRLDIPRERVVAVGSSFAGTCAISLGLRARAGWIIAGGVPARMGSMLKRLAAVDGPTREAKGKAEYLLSLADDGGGIDDAARFLDGMLVHTARRTTLPTQVDLFVSRRDVAYADVMWFAEQLERHPHIRTRVTIGEYGRHNDIQEEFLEFALDLLIARIGRAPEPQSTQKSLASPMENGHRTGRSAST